jgi:acyl carrier protein
MKLDDVIREAFELTPDTQIRDDHGPGRLAGWDSLGHVNLIAALESAYSIEIDMDEVLRIETVEDIKTMLADKGTAYS